LRLSESTIKINSKKYHFRQANVTKLNFYHANITNNIKAIRVAISKVINIAEKLIWTPKKY
jgi:ribosomal protein L1